jgi:hypothetical protein
MSGFKGMPEFIEGMLQIIRWELRSQVEGKENLVILFLIECCVVMGYALSEISKKN